MVGFVEYVNCTAKYPFIPGTGIPNILYFEFRKFRLGVCFHPKRGHFLNCGHNTEQNAESQLIELRALCVEIDRGRNEA